MLEVNIFNYRKKLADKINDHEIAVTEEDVTIIKETTEELEQVKSKDTDKEGNTTNKPIGIFNHCIDAMRYLAIERLSKSNTPRSGPMITLPSYR